MTADKRRYWEKIARPCRLPTANLLAMAASVRCWHDRWWLFGTAQFFRHQRNRGRCLQELDIHGLCSWSGAIWLLQFVLLWQNSHYGFVSFWRSFRYKAPWIGCLVQALWAWSWRKIQDGCAVLRQNKQSNYVLPWLWLWQNMQDELFWQWNPHLTQIYTSFGLGQTPKRWSRSGFWRSFETSTARHADGIG